MLIKYHLKSEIGVLQFAIDASPLLREERLVSGAGGGGGVQAKEDIEHLIFIVHQLYECTKIDYLHNNYTMGCPPVRGDNSRA